MPGSEAPLHSIPHRRLWFSLWLGAAVSIAVGGAVVARAFVVGSVEGGWHYPYAPQPGGMALLLLVLRCLVWSAAAAAAVLVPVSLRLRHWTLVVIWVLVATSLQWVLRSMAPVPLEAVFLSDGANSFYSVARQHDSMEILTDFSRIRVRAPLHVQSNMPGKLLLLRGLHLISARTDVLPWLLIGLSNLGALLTFGLVRDLLRNERAALVAAALYLFFPARNFFFPLMNTVTPLGVLACGWLLARWLRTGKTAYAMLMGVGLYALVLFEPLPLVMGLFFAALVLGAIARGEIAWERFVGQAGVLILVFIGASETVTAWSGFDLVKTFRTIAAHAVQFNESAARPYDVWVGANLREFAFGVGICQAVCVFTALWASFRGPERWRERFARPITVVCLGLLAVLAAVDLIGVNRGEVARLWIFLACFFQIPAAWVCSTLERRAAMALVVFSTALHTAVGVAMILFVVP